MLLAAAAAASSRSRHRNCYNQYLHAAASSASKVVVDLRSDTVTRPTPRMREKMHTAVVGDDVFGEDPTVLELERLASKLTGKANALFVASGTMSNLLAFISHANGTFGAELICGNRQHTHIHEQGNTASLAGIHTRTVPNQSDGTLDLKQVLLLFRGEDSHYAKPVVVSVENTHNECGGVPLSLDYLTSLSKALQNTKNGKIALHMDGARVGNAAVALNTTMARVCRDVDTVSVCLSKGMGAPVGSVLCGPEDFVLRARRARKALGGGWRQAGILAACGIEALETYETTVRRDHMLAQKLYKGLVGCPGMAEVLEPKTNMVYFEPVMANDVVGKLEKAGVLVFGGRGDKGVRVRAVLHCDVNEEMVDLAIERIRGVVVEGG
jgi:threonine aldolase